MFLFFLLVIFLFFSLIFNNFEVFFVVNLLDFLHYWYIADDKTDVIFNNFEISKIV